MRKDTKLLKSKYIYYFRMIDDERFNLFSDLIWDNSINNYFQLLNIDKFSSFMFNINYMCELMVRKWHYYLSYRNLLMNRCELGRQKIFKKELKIILHHKFCNDVVNCIIEFI